MNEKIRINIYVNKHNWQELGKYITCSKSEWVDRQVEKRIKQHDDVAEIERKMHEIEELQKNLAMDLETLSEQKEQILNQRKLNEQNFKLINDAMLTIRIVAKNQGYVEKTRVEFIANKYNLSYNTLKEQIEREHIEIKDIEQRNDTDTNDSQPY